LNANKWYGFYLKIYLAADLPLVILDLASGIFNENVDWETFSVQMYLWNICTALRNKSLGGKNVCYASCLKDMYIVFFKLSPAKLKVGIISVQIYQTFFHPISNHIMVILLYSLNFVKYKLFVEFCPVCLGI